MAESSEISSFSDICYPVTTHKNKPERTLVKKFSASNIIRRFSACSDDSDNEMDFLAFGNHQHDIKRRGSNGEARGNYRANQFALKLGSDTYLTPVANSLCDSRASVTTNESYVSSVGGADNRGSSYLSPTNQILLPLSKETSNYWNLCRHLGSERDGEDLRTELAKSRTKACELARSCKSIIFQYIEQTEAGEDMTEYDKLMASFCSCVELLRTYISRTARLQQAFPVEAEKCEVRKRSVIPKAKMPDKAAKRASRVSTIMKTGISEKIVKKASRARNMSTISLGLGEMALFNLPCNQQILEKRLANQITSELQQLGSIIAEVEESLKSKPWSTLYPNADAALSNGLQSRLYLNDEHGNCQNVLQQSRKSCLTARKCGFISCLISIFITAVLSITVATIFSY